MKRRRVERAAQQTQGRAFRSILPFLHFLSFDSERKVERGRGAREIAER
jgi:hypothetical protein